MAKSNWSGSSGWSTINDPTGKLNGRVLVASAGITATAEDYLLQVAGTTLAGTTFSYVDYEVQCNYAWPSGSQTEIFSGGILGLIARAQGYSVVSGVSLAQDCYIGRISYQDAKCAIVRRENTTDTVLAEADIPPTANNTGVRHELKFVCTGNAPATLQLYIDGSLAVNVGDNTSSVITTGDSGLIAGNGTVYVDNFAVLAYSATEGGGGYSGATPSDFLDDSVGDSSQFMRLWLKGDDGLTAPAGGGVNWANKAQVIDNTYIVGDGQTTQLPEITSAALNGLDVLRFDHTNSEYLKGAKDNAVLDINGSTYGRGFNVFYLVRFYRNTIGDAQNTTDTTNVAPIINYGRSYQTRLKWDQVDDDPNKNHQFDNNSNFPDTPATGAEQFTVGDWVILSYHSSTSGSAGFYKNGNLESSSNAQTTNFDLDSANIRLHLGRRNFNVTTEDYAYGSFDLAELLLIEAPQSTGLSETNRQKVEGYLAWKWGIESVLPAGHPYKSAPPV